MSVDAFIWFESPGVSTAPEGETKDKYYSTKKAFEIKNFSFGVENPTTIGSATGGAGAGQVKFGDFKIDKLTDLSSPLFFKNLCVGAHFANLFLELLKTRGEENSLAPAILPFYI